MREILFRGKTIKGDWVYGNLSILKIDLNNVPKGYYISNLEGMPFAFQIDPSTVGQKTEFTDRKGNQIFEGDRFKSLRYFGTVQFIESGFKLVKDGHKGVRVWSLSNHTCRSIEIIGNIHERP